MNPLEILALAKEVVLVAKKFNDLEFQKKIVELQSEVVGLTLELTEKAVAIARKDAQISDLEEKLRFKAKLVKADGAYYEADENGQAKGDPYCTRCWEVERKAVTIYPIGDKLMRGKSQCPECQATPPWPGRK
jgi:hypothetical protein